ncbi:MAG: MBOAT family O-acyltransferase [Phycisphaerae bacterium]
MPLPPPLFNPLTSPEPLTQLEILAGPLGLLAFLLLVPLVRLARRSAPHVALIAGGVAWVVLTAGPLSAAVLAVGVGAGVLWIAAVAAMRRRGTISHSGGVAAVWLGLTALIFPLWWWPQWPWFGWQSVRMPPLHNLGFAYFYLRLIAWGVDWSREPTRALDPLRSVCWLAYPPIMRLGPIVPREVFFERLAAWRSGEPIAWREVGKRFGWLIVGGVFLVMVANNTPKPFADRADYFAAPELYSTKVLWRAVYFIPIQIYLILWVYNELAAVVGLLVGIRVDNNFDCLPAATSVRDFWRRWHITVGAWLRTYIYIPLGGNRSPAWVTYTAVFGFCGVWHGASWSFLVWGLSQAVALVAQKWWDNFWLWASPAGRANAIQNPKSKIQNSHAGGGGVAPSRTPALLAWTGVCWLLTMHYQIVTIFMFADFEHFGTRVLRELWIRMWA